MRQRPLAPRRGIVHAERLAGVDAVDAVAHADAGTDVVLAPLRHFERDMGIGEMGARHADEVELAALDRVARGGDVLDARGVEGRNAGRGAHFAGEFEMRRRALAHAGNDVRKRLLGIDMAADHVDEIDQARADEPARDLDALDLAQAPLPVLVADHPQAHDEVAADAIADRAQDLEAEAHAIVETAAVVVLTPIGRRRPELIDEMPVALDLEPVETAGLHAFGGVGVGRDHALDVPVLHHFRKRPVRGLAHIGGRDHRQPVVLRPARCGARDA